MNKKNNPKRKIYPERKEEILDIPFNEALKRLLETPPPKKTKKAKAKDIIL